MQRLVLFLCITVLATTAAGAPLGELAQVSLIDRDSGSVLVAHYYQGQYWVAGRPGARYAIEVRNRSPERLLAVMSVDGVNVISGETAGWNQQGYVLDLDDDYSISGWRKSDAEIAAFTFTESQHSYAKRTGRPANVGVIGVALFRERPKRAEISAPSAPVQLGQAAPAPSAPAASVAPAEAPRQARIGVDPKLGTGHGAREISPVAHTLFDRLHEQPDEIISIHYDSLSNLIAMGIIPRPHPTVPGAVPFPRSTPAYVPDPPPEQP